MRGWLVALLLFLAAPSDATPASRDVMIHVYPENGTFHYAPAVVHVQPGGNVTLGHIFGNHSITSPDGLFNATGNATKWPTITAPLQPGSYPFYCWIEANATTTAAQGMAGTLIVALDEGASNAAPSLPTVSSYTAAAPELGPILLLLLLASWRRLT